MGYDAKVVGLLGAAYFVNIWLYLWFGEFVVVDNNLIQEYPAAVLITYCLGKALTP